MLQAWLKKAQPKAKEGAAGSAAAPIDIGGSKSDDIRSKYFDTKDKRKHTEASSGASASEPLRGRVLGKPAPKAIKDGQKAQSAEERGIAQRTRSRSPADGAGGRKQMSRTAAKTGTVKKAVSASPRKRKTLEIAPAERSQPQQPHPQPQQQQQQQPKKATPKQPAKRAKRGPHPDLEVTHAKPKKVTVDPAAEKPKPKRGGGGSGAYFAHMQRAPPEHLHEKPLPRGAPNCLRGKVFLITGVLDSLERDEAHDLIEKYGGTVAKSVVKKLTHAVLGVGFGMSKKKQLDDRPSIVQIDENGLFEMILSSLTAEERSKWERECAEKKAETLGSATFGDDASAATASATLPDTSVAEAISNDLPSALPPSARSPARRDAVGKTSAPALSPYDSGLPPALPSVSGPAVPVVRLSGKQESPATNQQEHTEDRLWVDKHRPLSPRDLIGNAQAAQQLQAWLSSWKPGQKGQMNAALLSGPPGIGKSSAAAIVARACSYEALEFNASDTRSAKLISDLVAEFTHSQSISSFFSAQPQGVLGSQQLQPQSSLESQSFSGNFASNTRSRSGKKCLIMDEVDGMGAGDRGGIAELIKVIKKSQVPIVCICNDRYNPKIKSLAGYCKDIRFQKPSVPDVVRRLAEIAMSEGFVGDRGVLEKLIIACNGDIRQMLNTLQSWRCDASLKELRDNDPTVQARLRVSKDTSLSLFDAVPVLFSALVSLCKARTSCPLISDARHCAQFAHKQRCPDGIRCRLAADTQHAAQFDHSRPLSERVDMYFIDSGMVPIYVQDTYIRAFAPAGARAGDLRHLEAIMRAADSISDGDVVDSTLRSTQNYGLMNTHAILSCVRPAALTRAAVPGGSQFPAWLGKNSTTIKNRRLLTEVASSMRAATGGAAKEELRLHYFSGSLRERLYRPLVERGIDGIDDVIATMDAYNLSRDDRQSVFDVSLLLKHTPVPVQNPLDQIPTQTKSAFTRQYNKRTHAVRVAPGSGKGMGRTTAGSAAGAVGVGDEQQHDEGELEASEDSGAEEDEAAAARLITEKKRPAARQKGASKNPKRAKH